MAEVSSVITLVFSVTVAHSASPVSELSLSSSLHSPLLWSAPQAPPTPPVGEPLLPDIPLPSFILLPAS